MKISERAFEQDGKLVVESSHDFNSALTRARTMRDAEAGVTGEKRLVGTIPAALITRWCKEAGVALHDTEARQELLKRKILSGEFDQFRVWQGTF